MTDQKEDEKKGDDKKDDEKKGFIWFTLKKIKKKKKKDGKTLQERTEAKSETAAAQQEFKPPATVTPTASVQQPQSELSRKSSKEKEQATENAKADESEKEDSTKFVVVKAKMRPAKTKMRSRKIILTGVDGEKSIFYQWVLNIAAMLSGFVVFVSQNYPPFYPLAAIGGACATASTTISLVVVTELALALAVLLSSITNCCISFATGYFGLLWTKARPPEKQWLSWIGLLLVLIGGAMISQVKNKDNDQSGGEEQEGFQEEVNEETWKRVTYTKGTPVNIAQPQSNLEQKSSFLSGFNVKRSLYVALALMVGLLAGLAPIPIIASQDSPQVFGETSKQPLQYIFSYLFGGFVTSSLILVVYSIFKKNKPYVKPELVLPALSGGLLYGCGCVTMYMALDNLSQAVAGPIVAMLPGCVAALWSVVYFREIKPGRNLFLLYAAILITLAGAMAIGFSK